MLGFYHRETCSTVDGKVRIDAPGAVGNESSYDQRSTHVESLVMGEERSSA
jgi:hypothetical protein